jgi:hypothetical protein
MRIVFFLLVYLSTTVLLAQGSKADSLINLLEQNPKDKAPLYQELIYEFVDVDNKKACGYARHLFALKLQSGDTAAIVAR